MIQDIFIGSAPNDKTGTPARQAGQMINENFAYLNSKISNKNQIITIGTAELVDQNFTINAGWVWEINGQQFSNPVDVVVNFPYSSTGKQRLDRIVFNTSNTFTKIVGTESVSNPIAENIPPDTIDFGISLVTDNSVGNPSFPIIGDVYVQKNETQDFILSGSETVLNQINLIDNRSSISLTGAVIDVKSIQLSGEFIRPGKLFFVKNRSGHNVNLWNNSGTGNIKFLFSNSQNFIIRPNEIIEFNLNANDSSALKLEYVGGEKQDISKQFEIGLSQSAQAEWHGATVIFTASCTITIPSYLTEGYVFNGITLAGVTITWAISSPKTWLFSTPSATGEKQIFSLIQRGATNSIMLLPN